MSAQIKTLRDINYTTNPEGRLLFTALTILTTHNYTDKTPDEVIELLNEKSSFLDDKKEDFWSQVDKHAKELISKPTT